jgi:hypothetical protein
LAATFLWIGIDVFRHPAAWTGYVPEIGLGLTRETTLTAIGAVDIAVGILFLVQLAPKITALVAAIYLAAIIGVQGVDAVLIRDVGLLGTALALLLWPKHYRRHRWRKRLSFWRRKDYAEE